MTSPRPLGSYGTDAPWVPWMWAGFGVVYLVLAVQSAVFWQAPIWAAGIVAVLGIAFLAGGALFWHASFRGKFAVWDEVLTSIAPPSRVLDLGCGRGAVVIQTARRFPPAQLDGVDLWRSVDQSGNSPEAAQANALENGVADRIRFTTADMTDLPFEDAVFDLVTASLSIHNIPSTEGRRRAIDEAWRVLQPGGRLLIVDISKTREYERRLSELGAADRTATNAGWRMWWSGPWMATRILTARKPA